MQRNEWKFDYTASTLANAAQEKVRIHQERLNWWTTKREEVMTTIRAEGLEIDERLVFSSRALSPKVRDFDRGAEIMIRNDLKKDLDECLKKLGLHTAKLSEYKSWQQVLTANPENRLSLDVADWQFFFGDGLNDAPEQVEFDF